MAELRADGGEAETTPHVVRLGTTQPKPATKSTVAAQALGRSAQGWARLHLERPRAPRSGVDGKPDRPEDARGAQQPLDLPVGSHTVVFKLGGKKSAPAGRSTITEEGGQAR